MPTFTPNYGLAKPLVNNATDQDLWGGELNGDMDIIDTVMKANADAIAAVTSIPVGGIVDYAGATEPANFMFCYGQALSRVTYSTLFTAIGTAFGAGDGSTTFNLPDYRGRIGAACDNMGGTPAGRLTSATVAPDGNTIGATGGEQAHTLNIAEMPAHAHEYGHTSSLGGGGNNPTPDVTPN